MLSLYLHIPRWNCQKCWCNFFVAASIATVVVAAAAVMLKSAYNRHLRAGTICFGLS